MTTAYFAGIMNASESLMLSPGKPLYDMSYFGQYNMVQDAREQGYELATATLCAAAPAIILEYLSSTSILRMTRQ